ncbi:pyridoxal phosphate-dependent aminotransferase [Streptomyces sp. CBMA152]|uniref:aminotransferase class I/II-fold pyridoxal phosphate-dependent enzyme n=1 Tax=Streptomyces sp. CBMA152 TaxID=1896312 RepID=UPI0016615E30|nr:pyridoxal phosphate-dependent aminotransferase [Streptomyces sp. CBMA152]MBD0741340.1 hypothetical protein [Streptomyces sp. CBMA152]
MASHPKNPSAQNRPPQDRSADELLALLAGAADPERRLAAHQELFPNVTNLATAENVLVYPSLREHVFTKLGTIEQQDAKYTTAYGSESLRQGIADMLRPLFSQELDWRDIFGISGVSAALECLAFALKDADVLRDGDRVLLPAPYWQGFNWCFEQRPGLVCVPVHLKERGPENFELTLEDIQRAYRTQPEPPKLLVLTNPNNPLGDTYEKELLEEIYAWVLNETGMHIISDEMYTHSRLTGSASEFVSALALDAYRAIDGARDRVHVVWGFAKDFGMSGFKAGAIISRSPAVHLAMTGVADKQETLSWFSPFDSLKHFVIGRMLQTRVGGKSYPLELMEQYRGLLTTACDTVRGELEKHGFRYRFRKGQNTAQFLWLDMRRYLPVDAPGIPAHAGPHFPQPDRIPGEFAVEGDKAQALTLPLLFPEIDSREEWLRWALANHAQVQLLPGQLLSCAEPGYFRLCFTAVETQQVVESVQRMGAFLH